MNTKVEQNPKSKFGVVLPPHLIEAIRRLASEEHRTISGQVALIIEQYLQQQAQQTEVKQ